MSSNPFDQACRYVAKLDPVAFIAWLLRIPPSRFNFRRWLDTRLIRFPGEPDRTCDTVAFLEDIQRGHIPWAMVLEFQMEPDALMFGRLLGYLTPLWLEMKPNEERGDRFQLGAIIVNLTGRGEASRTMDWPEIGARTELRVVECNLADKQAETVLAEVALGTAPMVVLPLIPLMQGGSESATIEKWIALASAESDGRRRSDYGGLALVFAEAAGCWHVWKEALKEWNVIQSKQVAEWQEQARKQGRNEGRTQGAAEMLLRYLRSKYGELPETVVQSVQAIGKPEDLDVLLVRATQSANLDEWRASLIETRNGAKH